MKLVPNRGWKIVGEDPEAARLVSCLEDVMQLEKTDKPARHLTIHVGSQGIMQETPEGLLTNGNTYVEHKDEVICTLIPTNDTSFPIQHIRYLSQIPCLDAQKFGGLLMHSALAEWKGRGIMFAGPWESGKTTISQRLHSPWRSLSDDLTLLTPDEFGQYLAHPWPTWSRFIEGGPGGAWDVQYTVPLYAIFLLSKDVEDAVEPVGEGQAACALIESANQAWREMSIGEHGEQILRLQRFDNACRLARKVPVYLLRHSLHGTFWQEFERVLG